MASDLPFYKRAIMAFCITDEVFALAAMEKDEVGFPFFGGLMITPIFGWTLGTFLGAVASSLLSPMLQGCFGIALYCMFIAIIIPPARKSRKVALAVVVAAALASAIYWCWEVRQTPESRREARKESINNNILQDIASKAEPKDPRTFLSGKGDSLAPPNCYAPITFSELYNE